MLREAFAEERTRLHAVIEQHVQEVAGGWRRARGATDPSHDRAPRHGPRSALSVGIIVTAILAGVGLALHQTGDPAPAATLGSDAAPATMRPPVVEQVPTAKADAARLGDDMGLSHSFPCVGSQRFPERVKQQCRRKE